MKHFHSILAITGASLLALLHTVSADDCVAWTWSWDAKKVAGAAVAAATPSPGVAVKAYVRAATIEPGDINCRDWTQTYDNVGYWSCGELADKSGITIDKFWILNPTLAPDCDGIQPNTEYCIDGCK